MNGWKGKGRKGGGQMKTEEGAGGDGDKDWIDERGGERSIWAMKVRGWRAKGKEVAMEVEKS